MKQLKTILLFIAILILLNLNISAQNYPIYGSEKSVTINGLTFDAMEPFISTDGNTLFFNSLNSGGNTNLYYATRINDTTFTYIGLVNGTYDPSPNHLDAVASIDSAKHFFWTSLRTIPNLHQGQYLNGTVTNISKVYGTCNIPTAGWIIMDAAIAFQGNLLYYSNAYFGPTYTECVGVPCKAQLAVANKINDSTFNKAVTSDAVFSNVNDTNYIVYAPQVTKDGLELYFTRLLKGSVNTEICVSVRNTLSDNFSSPVVIYAALGFFPEAASPSTDKQKIYYHKKIAGLYKIFLRYRTGSTNLNEKEERIILKIHPNPTQDYLKIDLSNSNESYTVTLYSIDGKEIIKTFNNSCLDMTPFSKGVYFLSIVQGENYRTLKVIKE